MVHADVVDVLLDAQQSLGVTDNVVDDGALRGGLEKFKFELA